MEHGVLFKILRESHKMSKETVSDQLGISVSSITRLENGERQATHDEIEKGAHLFHVDPSFFFQKDGTYAITHGDNSHSVVNGNVISIDKELFMQVMESLKTTNEVNKEFIQFMKRH